jgi:hypothetical protein
MDGSSRDSHADRDKALRSFPFLDPGFLAAPGNDLPLWRRLARPSEDDLFFMGFLQL